MTESEVNPAESPAKMSADELLPPVQAPAASFIVQLFLIPLLIVSIIVSVWLMFSYLARTNDNPQELAADIERLNHSSWQKALTLAQLLRDTRNTELKGNKELATRLADLLEKQIKEGRTDNDHHRLRLYLCRALGHFNLDTGCDALAMAATHEKNAQDISTRQAALQALAELAGTIDPALIAQHEEVVVALKKGCDEYSDNPDDKKQRDTLRSTATYTLGLMPANVSQERLAELLLDPSIDVNYNAALGLARQGDERSIEVLIEMLNPPDDALNDSDPQLNAEQQAGQKEWKRTHVVTNALRSAAKLYGEHPTLDISELKAAIETLANDEAKPSVLRIRASEVLRVLNQ